MNRTIYFQKYLIPLSLLLFILTYNCTISNGLVINEVMSSNKAFYFDEDNEDGDWIEVYNNSSDIINLSDYYLSDNLSKPKKWQFPNISIDPQEYIVVFCDEKNRKLSKWNLHTNFSISKEGEEITLSKKDELIHFLPPQKLKPNQSFGIVNHNSLTYEVFDTPTPGQKNIKDNFQNEVVFSQEGAIYETPFNLSLNLKNKNPEHIIKYTTDGSTPEFNSETYKEALFLDEYMYSHKNISRIQITPDKDNFIPEVEIPKCIVVKAAVFDKQGTQISPNITNTYLIKELFNSFLKRNYPHDDINILSLPIVSLTSDSLNLFDYETGIMVPGKYFDPELSEDWTGNYFQRGSYWERSAYFEYFGVDKHKYKERINIRVNGNSTRKYAQKSLRLIPLENNFNFDFLGNNDTNHSNIVLTSYNNSWLGIGLENYLSNKISTEFNVLSSEFKPCIVFLNGEFWGIYFLQDRFDENVIAKKYGIKSNDINLIEGQVESWIGHVQSGSLAGFDSLYNFIDNNDLTVQSNYDYVASQIDIENFIDYQALQIVIGNMDWPANNVRYWKANGKESKHNKWKWIFFDGGGSLSDYDYPSFKGIIDTSTTKVWPTNAHSTLLFRKLLENQTYKTQFVKQLVYRLNSTFDKDRYVRYKDEITKQIRPLIPLVMDRFNYLPDIKTWDELSNLIDIFLINRKCALASQYLEAFGKNDLYKVCAKDSSVEPVVLADHFLLTYPNPSSDVVFLIINNTSEDNYNNPTIEIYDINGNLVLTPKVEISAYLYEIDTRALSTGKYFIKVTENNKPSLWGNFLKVR